MVTIYIRSWIVSTIFYLIFEPVFNHGIIYLVPIYVSWNFPRVSFFGGDN